jgi:hypothetical protein
MTEFAYDRQLATIPDVVKDLVDRHDYPALDPTRPILFAGIGLPRVACEQSRSTRTIWEPEHSRSSPRIRLL